MMIFLYSNGSQTCVCSSFEQGMAIHICKRTHSHHRMVKETNETINFLCQFILLHILF